MPLNPIVPNTDAMWINCIYIYHIINVFPLPSFMNSIKYEFIRNKHAVHGAIPKQESRLHKDPTPLTPYEVCIFLRLTSARKYLCYGTAPCSLPILKTICYYMLWLPKLQLLCWGWKRKLTGTVEVEVEGILYTTGDRSIHTCFLCPTTTSTSHES